MDILAHNTPAFVTELKTPEDIGDVLLTGATGFLGIHVLKYLLDRTRKTVYCLLRPGQDTAEKRLQNMLMYYFDGPMWEMFGSRIKCIEGDITEPESLTGLAACDFKTVINCAACLKESHKILEAVNWHGVENLISFCREHQKRLVQVSTVSIAGTAEPGKVPEGKLLNETDHNFGQKLEDKYVYTKFKAEEAILKAIEQDGLDAKIIRAGNLTSRYIDGEFQVNFVRSTFMQGLRAYAALGKVPVSVLDQTVEFSPVDRTAEAVVLLAATPKDFTVFHATNGHRVETGDVIDALFQAGVQIKIVDEAEFQDTFREAYADKERRRIVAPLIAFQKGQGGESYVGHSNAFTTKALYRLRFKWPIINEAYLINAFRALEGLDFFRAE